MKPIGTSLAEIIKASGRSPHEQAGQTTVLIKRRNKRQKCLATQEPSTDVIQAAGKCRCGEDGGDKVLEFHARGFLYSGRFLRVLQQPLASCTRSSPAVFSGCTGDFPADRKFWSPAKETRARTRKNETVEMRLGAVLPCPPYPGIWASDCPQSEAGVIQDTALRSHCLYNYRGS